MNGWEALCVRAAAWAGIGPERGMLTEAEMELIASGLIRAARIRREVAGLALFARLMSLLDRRTIIADPFKAESEYEEYGHEAKEIEQHRLAIEGLTTTGDPPAEAVKAYLRRVWEGSDRELPTLLREAWGPSPTSAPSDPAYRAFVNAPPLSRPLTEDEKRAIEAWKASQASDLAGLAARESQAPRKYELSGDVECKLCRASLANKPDGLCASCRLSVSRRSW